MSTTYSVFCCVLRYLYAIAFKILIINVLEVGVMMTAISADFEQQYIPAPTLNQLEIYIMFLYLMMSVLRSPLLFLGIIFGNGSLHQSE